MYCTLGVLPLANWELIGPHLGLRHAQLAMIKADNYGRSDPTQHCVAAMIRKWLEMDDSFSSYEEGLQKAAAALHSVLHTVGENTIADTLLLMKNGKYDINQSVNS